jgi:predicted Zn-dependent protease
MIAAGAAAIRELLDELRAPARVEVIEERNELLRFGASRITNQHSEEQVRVRVQLIRDGRAAWGSVGAIDRAVVRGLQTRLEAVIGSLPPVTEPTRLPRWEGAPRPARTSFHATTSATAGDRADAFREVLRAFPRGTAVGGSVVHGTVRHTVGTTDGNVCAEERSRALLQVVGSFGGQSAYARGLDRDWSTLDRANVLRTVADGLEPLPPRALVDGQTYRAVLAPQAVITLVATLGQVGFGGRAYASGVSRFAGRLGEPVLSPLVNLIDNGRDPAGLPSTFDCEGSPKQRVELVRAGVLRGVVHDARSGAEVGVGSTGHGVPPAWRFGADPIPSHLLLDAGDAADDDLLAACAHGLYIQRVDYVRVVQARETLVTGTTRDATLWIEKGKIVARVPQFRFTLRLAEVLGVGTLLALGARRERGETPFMESIVAPAALVAAFPVDQQVGQTAANEG